MNSNCASVFAKLIAPFSLFAVVCFGCGAFATEPSPESIDWKSFDDPTSVLLTQQFANSVSKLAPPQQAKAIQRLQDSLKSDSVEIRRRSALSLAALGDLSGTPRMVQDLSTVTGDDLNNVVVALRIMKDPRAIPALKSALKNNSPYVRGIALCALGEFKDASAYDEIVAHTKDKGGLHAVKPRGQLNCIQDCPAFSACYALGAIGDERAIPVLIGLVDDPDLKNAAMNALKVLAKEDVAKEDLGNDPSKWKAWWKARS